MWYENMKKKRGIIICIMMLIVIINITPIISKENIIMEINKTNLIDSSKWFFKCYVEIDEPVYASRRNLFLPHINDNDDTFCLRWINRFCNDSSVIIYSNEGGDLIYENYNVKEFHMIWFLGNYNYRGDPLSLRGNVFCIKCFDEWT